VKESERGWQGSGNLSAPRQQPFNVENRNVAYFFFSSRRRHTRSVSAFLLNRSSDLQETLTFFCVSKNVSVSCAYTQGKREQFSGFNRTLDAINNVFRKFSAFHDETGRLNVDGMNIISNEDRKSVV